MEVKVRVFDFHFLEYRLANATQFFQMDCFNSPDPLWQFDNIHNFFLHSASGVSDEDPKDDSSLEASIKSRYKNLNLLWEAMV